MNNEPTLFGIVRDFLLQLPVLIVCVIGFIIAFRFWRKAPQASLWLLAALMLTLGICGHNIYSKSTNSYINYYVLVPIVRAISYLLLIIGFYVGRRDQSTAATGVANTIWQPVVTLFRNRPELKNVFIFIFFAVWVCVFLGNSVYTFILPESYSSKASIKMEIPGDTVRFQTLSTEREMITSDLVLSNVTHRLDLKTKWGKIYNEGKSLTEAECVELLRAKIDVAIPPNTTVIEVVYSDEKPSMAAELANATVYSYCSYSDVSRSNSANAHPLRASIMNYAQPSLHATQPNKPLHIVGGAWIGLWLAVIAGLIVTWIAAKIDRRREIPSYEPEALSATEKVG